MVVIAKLLLGDSCFELGPIFTRRWWSIWIKAMLFVVERDLVGLEIFLYGFVSGPLGHRAERYSSADDM